MMTGARRELQQIFKILLKIFFIFLSVLGIDISDLDFPPSEGQIMILDSVFDSDVSDRLRVVIRFCVRYFTLQAYSSQKEVRMHFIFVNTV